MKTEKPKFWIEGGIHAREWIAHATVLYMAGQVVYVHVYSGWSETAVPMRLMFGTVRLLNETHAPQSFYN